MNLGEKRIISELHAELGNLNEKSLRKVSGTPINVSMLVEEFITLISQPYHRQNWPKLDDHEGIGQKLPKALKETKNRFLQSIDSGESSQNIQTHYENYVDLLSRYKTYLSFYPLKDYREGE